MKVFKWNVPVDDKVHSIGAGKVVHVACQIDYIFDVVQVWTQEMVEDPDAPISHRQVQAFGTMHPIPDNAKHLGTGMASSGMLVWHIYEVTK